MNTGTADPFFREREMTSCSSHCPLQRRSLDFFKSHHRPSRTCQLPRRNVFAVLSALPTNG
jgi:hypothetical protein